MRLAGFAFLVGQVAEKFFSNARLIVVRHDTDRSL